MLRFSNNSCPDHPSAISRNNWALRLSRHRDSFWNAVAWARKIFKTWPLGGLVLLLRRRTKSYSATPSTFLKELSIVQTSLQNLQNYSNRPSMSLWIEVKNSCQFLNTRPHQGRPNQVRHSKVTLWNKPGVAKLSLTNCSVWMTSWWAKWLETREESHPFWQTASHVEQAVATRKALTLIVGRTQHQRCVRTSVKFSTSAHQSAVSALCWVRNLLQRLSASLHEELMTNPPKSKQRHNSPFKESPGCDKIAGFHKEVAHGALKNERKHPP